jgi:hypothetical protein
MDEKRPPTFQLRCPRCREGTVDVALYCVRHACATFHLEVDATDVVLKLTEHDDRDYTGDDLDWDFDNFACQSCGSNWRSTVELHEDLVRCTIADAQKGRRFRRRRAHRRDSSR